MRLLAAMLALVALLAAPPANADTSLFSIKNKLIRLALDQISSPGSFEITTGSIKDLPNGGTSLVNVKVSDNEGVWLTIDQLDFAWEPTKLLSGELSITQLKLIGLDVKRLPSKSAKRPTLKPQKPLNHGPFGWPRAPIDVSVKNVSIEKGHLAKGVLAQAVDFQAKGHAIDQGDVQEVEATLTRTDQVQGSFHLLLHRDFKDGTLKLDVSGHEAPGGLVAATAGLPADAPAKLDLKADGTIDNWKVNLDAAVEHVLTAQGNATFDYSKRLNAKAHFTATPGPELSPRLKAVLGDGAQLDADVVQQPDGRIQVVSGKLASRAVQLTASGALATGPTGGSNLQVSLTALAPLAKLVQGVAFDRFTFDGTVTGPTGALAAKGTLGLEGLATAKADIGSLSLDGQVAQSAGGYEFNLAGQGTGIRIARVGPDVIGQARLEAVGTFASRVLTLSRASLQSDALGADAAGSYDLGKSSGDLSMKLRLPKLAPVAAAYGMQVKGSAAASTDVKLVAGKASANLTVTLADFAMSGAAAHELSLEGQVSRTGTRISFDLTGNGRQLSLGQVPPSLTPQARLVAQGTIAGGTLDLSKLRLTSPVVAAGASGKVGLTQKTVALDYTLTVPALAPLAEAYGVKASGAIAANGRAEGSLTAPQVRGKVTLSGASVAGTSYGDVTLSHDVTLGPTPEGHMSLDVSGGRFGGAGAQTRFRLEGKALTLSQVKAQLMGASLSGHATVDLGTRLADGSFDLSVPDLKPLGKVAGTALSGTANGTVTLSSAGGRQQARVALKAPRLASAGAEAKGAALNLTVSDLRGTPRVDLALTADSARAGSVSLAALKATARGPLGRLDLAANANGKIGDKDLKIALAGRAKASVSPADVTLSRAEITAGSDTVKLERPLSLRIGGGLFEAKGLALSLPQNGSLTGDAAMRPAGFTGNLKIQRLPLGLIGRWTAMRVSAGRLDASAVFDTRPGSAKAKISAKFRKVVFQGSQAAGRTLDADLDANWDGAQHDAKLEIRGDFGEPIRAHLSMPLRPRAGRLPAIPPGGKLDGAFSWKGKIGDLWALVPLPGSILDGQAVIDLKIGGTVNSPRITGTAEVQNGQFQNLALGTILTNVKIGTDISQGKNIKVTFDANDGAGGKVSARGTLNLGASPARLDLTATSDSAVLVRRDDVKAAVSGKVSVSGPLNRLSAKGKLHVDKAEVQLVDAMPPNVVTLNGIRVKGQPKKKKKTGGGGVISLDLTVSANRDIFVRGRGLDSEWRMHLSVAGSAASPVVTGKVEKVRGQLQLLGRTFQLERGTVTFDGGQKIDPELDVYLQAENDGVTGGIVISGRASDPKLSFSSTQGLPESEVMPRLLFGQSRQSLTGAQALQLGTGIASLMGGGGSGLLNTLRETAGLDMLRVGGSSLNTASVTVGRNVGKRVFIGAKQGLSGQSTAATVEVQVFKNVTVDTEISPQGSSNIGITLKKDF